MREDRLILKSTSTSPTTEVLLAFAESDDVPDSASPLREFRAPQLPDRITQGPITSDVSDPLVEFIWSRTDWAKGGGYQVEDSGQGGYMDSQGQDSRFEGSFGPGMARDSIDSGSPDFTFVQGPTKDTSMDMLVRNGHAERGSTTGWTAGGGVTLTVSSSVKHQGTYSFEVTANQVIDPDQVIAYQDLTNYTQYKSRTIGFSFQASEGPLYTSNIRIRINDGIDATDSGVVEVGQNGNFVWCGGTHVVNALATQMRVEIRTGELVTTGATMFFDNVVVLPYSAAENGMGNCAGLVRRGTDLYGAWGACVVKWDETLDVWNAVLIGRSNESNITDLIEYQGNIYVAFGPSYPYWYGSNTSWTESTALERSGAGRRAIYWAKARDSSGTSALWKSETTIAVSSTPDPRNGSTAWSALLSVGDINRDITRLYGAFDSLVVGKVDGLWSYVRWDENNSSGNNLFRNELPDFETQPSDRNFAHGVAYAGWLYLELRQGAIRWKPGSAQIITRKFTASKSGISGIITGFIATAEDLFVITADRLCAFDSNSGTVHILDTLETSGGPGEAARYNFGATTSDGQMIIAGSFVGDKDNTDSGVQKTYASSTATSMRWRLPTTHPAPYLEVSGGKRTMKSSLWETSTWYGQVPGKKKAYLSLTLLVDGVDSDDTIKVEYGLDGALPTTTTLGTISGTDRVQTLYFHSVTAPETNAVGYGIQLRLTTERNSATSSIPIIRAITLTSTLRPAIRKTWEMHVRVEGNAVLPTGYSSPDTIQTVLGKLDTLESQIYPIVLVLAESDQVDLADGTEYTVNIIDRNRVSVGHGYEIHKLTLQEALTSS
jgi:hypothetical protein